MSPYGERLYNHLNLAVPFSVSLLDSSTTTGRTEAVTPEAEPLSPGALLGV